MGYNQKEEGTTRGDDGRRTRVYFIDVGSRTELKKKDPLGEMFHVLNMSVTGSSRSLPWVVMGCL